MIIIYLFILIFLSLKSNLISQTSGSDGFTDAKSAGMALTYVSNTRGIDALGINPANIALKNNKKFSLKTFFPFPPINIAATTPLSIDKYNYFFGGVEDSLGNIVGRFLTNDEKDELNRLLGESDLLFNLNLNYLSFTIYFSEKVGSFGFAITDRLGTNLKLSKIFTDMIFSGIYPLKVYSFSDLTTKATFWREISFSYGRKIFSLENSLFKDLYGGISFKLLKGYYYLNSKNNESYFRLNENDILDIKWNYEIQHALSPSFASNYGKDSIVSPKDFSLSLFPETAGNGVGFDIGFTGIINEQLTVALALTDLGSINWGKNQATITGKGEIKFEGYTSKEQIDSLTNKFKKIQNDLNSAFSSSSPTALRLGASYQLDKAPFVKKFPGQMLISFDYNQGFNNEIGNTTKPRFSLGIDYNPSKWIPTIRTGVSVGGKLGFLWAFGLGISIGPIDIDFATSNFATILSPNTSRKINLFLESSWKF